MAKLAHIDKKWLIEKYVDEGLSCGQIAAIVGTCTRQAIFKRLKGLEIETRSKRHSIFYVDGQRCKISQGYFWVWAPYHPRQNGGYTKRSVLELEKKLGRALKDEEMPHHIDNNRMNDAPENLEATDRSNHMSQHNPALKRWGRGNGLTIWEEKILEYLKGKSWTSPTMVGRDVGGLNTKGNMRGSPWASYKLNRLIGLGLVEKNKYRQYRLNPTLLGG